MTLDVLLRAYRDSESTLAVAPLVNDGRAMAVLAAWLAYPPPPWSPPVYDEGEHAGQPVPQPSDVRELWRWIWAPVWKALDLTDFAAASGVPADECRRVFRVAMNQRLIYPDGTISNPAEKLLGVYTRAKLKGAG